MFTRFSDVHHTCSPSCTPTPFVHHVTCSPILFTKWVCSPSEFVHQVGLFTRWGCSPGGFVHQVPPELRRVFFGPATCLFWICNRQPSDLRLFCYTMSARVPTHRRLEAASEPGRTHRLAGTLPRPTRGRPSQLVKRFASARRKVCSAGVERLQRQPASGA